MHPLVKNWFVAQPDLTLSEVQQKLSQEVGISLSQPQFTQGFEGAAND
jgi:hypothetical protein